MYSPDLLPHVDAFQQVIFTPAGTIDVIATDGLARRRNSRLAAEGATRAHRALRRGLANGLRAVAGWLDVAPRQLPSPRA